MATTEKKEINVFNDNKTNTCSNSDLNKTIQKYRKQETNKHFINRNELNLLNKDIPKELINIQKPFGKSLFIKNKSLHLYLNNNKNKGCTVNKSNNEDSLVKPTNKFNIFDNIDNNNNNTILNETFLPSHNNSIKENYFIEEQPLVYPINKKKQTFLNQYQTLAVKTTKESMRKQKKDFFMNIYNSISFNKKKIKSISNKVYKLYDNNRKQTLYKAPLKHKNNYLYTRSISPLLSYKNKRDKKEKKSNIKSSFEKEKIYNEILLKAKQESEMISQKKNVSKSQKNIMNRYMLQGDNQLNEIEEKINKLLNKKGNVNCDKNMNNKSCDNDIKLKIEKQIEEMNGIKNEINEDIEENVYLNNDFSSDNDINKNKIEIL